MGNWWTDNTRQEEIEDIKMAVNHDHLSATAGFPLTEMEIMWILMVVMFAWNFVMAYQHHRLKKKTDCFCGRVDDDNTAKAKRNEAV